MNWSRIRYSAGMCLRRTGRKRAQYLKKHQIFHSVGNHCMVMFRKIPLYPKLISLGNNVWIASNVLLITHDAIHSMLNHAEGERGFRENVGVIDIRDNVFIGSHSTVLPNVTIGPNVIVGAGSLVNKSIQNGVYAGVPAKYICSFEEFTEKRRQMPCEIRKKADGDLSEETIEALWKLHHGTEGDSHEQP